MTTFFDPNNYKIEKFTAKNYNSRYVKSTVTGTDGLYIITLEDGYILPSCVEIFPNTKLYKTYEELPEGESEKFFETAFSDTASDSERIKAFTVIIQQEGRKDCNIFENKTDGKFYYSLGKAETDRAIEKVKEKIYSAHITEATVKKMYKVAIIDKDEEAAETMMNENIANTTFKISPYEPSGPVAAAVIKRYGTFFNGDKTKVAMVSDPMMYIIIAVIAFILLAAAIGGGYYYYTTKNKKKTNMNMNNTVTKFSFGRIKRRRNVK